MNNSSNIFLSNTNNEITQNWLLELLPKLLINNDKERVESEKQLEQYYFNPSLYKNLIELGLYNTTISDNERMQVFIILRKIIKDNLLINKTNTTPLKMKTISEENGLKVEDHSNNSNSSDIKKLLVASKEDKYIVEYFELENDEFAKKNFDSRKETYDNTNVIKSKITNSGSNFDTYALTANKRYIYLSRIDNTVLLLLADEKDKDDAKDLVKKYGY